MGQVRAFFLLILIEYILSIQAINVLVFLNEFICYGLIDFNGASIGVRLSYA